MGVYYKDLGFRLYKGDCNSILPQFPSGTIDLVFADPPYFLSDKAYTFDDDVYRDGDYGYSGNKGRWDKISGGTNGVDTFNLVWVYNIKRLMKKNGWLIITCSRHNLFSVGWAIKKCGLYIAQEICWYKPNPPPCFSCRSLKDSIEHILLVKMDKSVKHYFDYPYSKSLNDGKQLSNVWSFTPPLKIEKRFGKHPTQKPLKLLEQLLWMYCDVNALVLDPFCGSGTSGVAASLLGRRYLGIDKESEYLEIAKQRYKTRIDESGL